MPDDATTAASAAPPLQAPFPWFGAKSRVADDVWEALGNPPNYVEPFFGSGAVLLARPFAPGTETINDRDGMVANFWRSVAQYPDDVAKHADWPVNENDLTARHAYLVSIKDDFQARLEGDPFFCDPHIAGWWVWGICSWIGTGWCSGKGPWRSVDGKLVVGATAGKGINRKRPHIGDAGVGINRQLPHLGNAGQGINRHRQQYDWIGALSARLRTVRVCCGDWSRIIGPSPTVHVGLTGVFLDPPYGGEAGRCNKIYASEDLTVAGEVNAWCAENGDNKLLRIVLCGYAGEHDNLESLGWRIRAWKAPGGYGGGLGGVADANRHRERLWFSPHCLDQQWRLL